MKNTYITAPCSKCGKVFTARTDHYNRGDTKTCGSPKCNIHITHGLSKTVEYSAWLNMRARCYYTKNPYYDYYGGRGIVVCDAWKQSFESFIDDVGPRPEGRYSLDRINNDGNYVPENVRWATPYQQNQNKRYSRRAV